MYANLPQARQFSNKNFREIHSRAVVAAQELKQKESQMIRALQEVDRSKTYRFCGYNSLYQYAVQALGLSEHAAYNFIAVARKSYEIPALQQAVDNQEITVSKARKITSVIDNRNQLRWLSLAKTLPKRALEKQVAAANPKEAVPETARFVSDTRLNLQLGISEDLYHQLEKARALVSQKKQAPVTMEETLSFMLEKFLEAHDPLARAQRVTKRKVQAKLKNSTRPGTSRASNSNNPKPKHRQAIPAKTLHQLHLRDQNRCCWRQDNGQICGATMYLEVHHKKPLSHGGTHHLDNLITLCSGHHKAAHFPTQPPPPFPPQTDPFLC